MRISISSPGPLPATRCSRTKLFSAIILLLSAAGAHAQNTLDKAGLTSASPASGAYSLRLLSTGYAGSAIQVRRSSDNTTQDIGFTANGDLDTATLKTFVGAGSGYVSIWYDQSGYGNNLTQAAASRQPTIVNTGVVTRQSGQPFITFFGQISSSNYNSLALATPMTTVGHVSAVHRFESGGDGFILGHLSFYYWHSNRPSGLINTAIASASVQASHVWANGVAYTPGTIPYPTTLTVDEIEPSTPATGTTWDNIGTDRGLYHNTTDGGGYSELIVFPAALSGAVRHALESSQGSYFALTVTLPLEWLSFTAQPQGENVLLRWQTAAEQNNDHFTVQHSDDGQSWTDIATVPAAGNGSQPLTYQYLAPAGSGARYYRVRQTDIDGKSSYSSVVSVQPAAAAGGFTVSGNPVRNGLLTLQLSQPMLLSLYDAAGHLLWQQSFGAGTHRIGAGGYAKGLYWLKGNAKTEKILLQ